MPLALPLLIPFAEIAGIAIGAVTTGVGLKALSDKVEDYIEDNPENAEKIFAMIMPEQGLASIFNTEADDGEEVSEEELGEIDVKEPTKKEIVLEAVRRARAGRGNYSSPDATGPAVSGQGNVIRGLEDAGKIRKGPNPNYDPNKKKFNHKRFHKKKYADGGMMEYANGGGIGSMMQRKSFRGGGMDMGNASNQKQSASMGNKNTTRTSNRERGIQNQFKGPRGTTKSTNNDNNNDNNNVGGINTLINNSTKVPFTTKAKNTFNSIINNPLTRFVDPRSKLGLGMSIYKSFRDFKPKDEDLILSNDLPSNDLKTELTKMQQKMLSGPQKNLKNIMGISDQEILNNISPFNNPENPATLEEVQTFYGADGGRVNYNQGSNWWDTLDAQGMNVYNSMKRGGHDDATIQGQLAMLGYYDPNTTPPDSTPDTPQVVQQLGYQGGDNFSPIKSVTTDPRISAANEADIRNRQLTSMGINDPFADEISLSGAYYGDMPTDTSNLIGKQSMLGKAKQGLSGIVGNVKGLMDNPIGNAIGFAMNPVMGGLKGIASMVGNVMPVNQRSIQENIMGNMGVAVNDIGQIVSTGDYNDPNNVMAGYNLNRMTPATFKNRIDKIRNRSMPQTIASANRIKSIKEAQRRFELGEKLKEERLVEKQLKRAQKEIEAKGYQDYGQGGADQATQDSYNDSQGNYAGASTEDYGGGE